MDRDSDQPASIKARLLNIARDTDRPFNELLQAFTNERFLYRLSISRHSSSFILKGAQLFHVWGLPGARPTRDVDLLGHTRKNIRLLISMFKEICSIPVPEDGVLFDSSSLKGERIRETIDYNGIRFRFNAYLGKAKIPMQVDIGFGDIVFPSARIHKYPSILSMPSPRILAYPPETVIAEKLQAMIHLGAINSRMKDFYDIWILSNQFKLQKAKLQKAIGNTFSNRRTKLTADPLPLSESFARSKQTQWAAFLKTSAIHGAPESFEQVIEDLHDFLGPLIKMNIPK